MDISNKFFNITNHQLTTDQRQVIERARFQIIEMSDDLKFQWGNVPPEADISILWSIIMNVVNFINDNVKTWPSIALVQGEPVVSLNVVEILRSQNKKIISVVATTKRETIESVNINNGQIEKKSIFKHVGFRPYYFDNWTLLKEIGF